MELNHPYSRQEALPQSINDDIFFKINGLKLDVSKVKKSPKGLYGARTYRKNIEQAEELFKHISEHIMLILSNKFDENGIENVVEKRRELVYLLFQLNNGNENGDVIANREMQRLISHLRKDSNVCALVESEIISLYLEPKFVLAFELTDEEAKSMKEKYVPLLNFYYLFIDDELVEGEPSRHDYWIHVAESLNIFEKNNVQLNDKYCKIFGSLPQIHEENQKATSGDGLIEKILMREDFPRLEIFLQSVSERTNFFGLHSFLRYLINYCELEKPSKAHRSYKNLYSLYRLIFYWDRLFKYKIDLNAAISAIPTFEKAEKGLTEKQKKSSIYLLSKAMHDHVKGQSHL
ncbi:hypothetical protein BY996DRAFT_6682215 [Phakopsora pachyrhizi]|nr:hypothetical protein BY996DRAFT_6682215 [Phakopsora pachyrhizi]